MYPVDEPLSSPTKMVDIYLPNDDLRIASNFEASSSNLNDQHDGLHTTGPPSQLWHDGRFERMPPPPPPSSYHYRFDSLRDAADGPSTTTSTSIPQPLPYGGSVMSLSAQSHPQVDHFQPDSAVGSMYLSSMQMPMHQHDAAGTLHSVGAIPDFSSSNMSHPQPEYQGRVMAPASHSDGAVRDRFQPDLGAASMYTSSMQMRHHDAATFHSAAATPTFSSSDLSHPQPEYQGCVMAPTSHSDDAVRDCFQPDSGAASMYPSTMQMHHRDAPTLHSAAATPTFSSSDMSHPQPQYQTNTMAPVSHPDGDVRDRFQPGSGAASMHLQMPNYHDAAAFHSAAADLAFSQSYHYSASGPPSHLYHLPEHIGSTLQGYSQPFLIKGGDALLPTGVEEFARREDETPITKAAASQDASHSQKSAKQRTTTFHPYQWPPPRKSRLSTRKSTKAGLEPSDSVPLMAAPTQPVAVPAPSVPAPDPSELLYNINNVQHQRIVESAAKEIVMHAVNNACLSTGPERKVFVEVKLADAAASEYSQVRFGKQWAALNRTTLYLMLSEPYRSIMHTSKKVARAGVQRGFRLRPPLRPAAFEPGYQKAAVENLLDHTTFPPRFVFGEDETGSHFLENDLVWDVLVNTVTELKLYQHIKTLKSLFCASAAAVKCALQELKTGKLVEVDFAAVEYQPLYESLINHIDNEISSSPPLLDRWEEYNQLTHDRLRQICS